MENDRIGQKGENGMNKDLSKQYIDAKELIKDTETQKLDIADQLAVMAHNVLDRKSVV